MTWGELSNFTWGELSALKWGDISEDKYSLLQKLWNKEITLSPEAEIKLKELCTPFVEDYAKQYGKPFNVKEFLSTCASFLQALVNLHNLCEAHGPSISQFLDTLFQSLK